MLLRKVLSWQAIRINKFLILLLLLFGNIYSSVMVFSLLLSNMYVGILLGVFYMTMMPFLTFTMPDFGKGLFRKMILNEVKMFENELSTLLIKQNP